MQMHHEISGLRTVNGALRLGFPGVMRFGIIWVDPNDVQGRQVFKFEPVDARQFSTEDQMEKLLGCILACHLDAFFFLSWSKCLNNVTGPVSGLRAKRHIPYNGCKHDPTDNPVGAKASEAVCGNFCLQARDLPAEVGQDNRQPEEE